MRTHPPSSFPVVNAHPSGGFTFNALVDAAAVTTATVLLSPFMVDIFALVARLGATRIRKGLVLGRASTLNFSRITNQMTEYQLVTGPPPPPFFSSGRKLNRRERGGNFLLSPASAGEVLIIPFLTGQYLLRETTF